MASTKLDSVLLGQIYLDQLVLDAAHHVARFYPDGEEWPVEDCRQAFKLLKAGSRCKGDDFLVSDICATVGCPEPLVYRALFHRAELIGKQLYRFKKYGGAATSD